MAHFGKITFGLVGLLYLVSVLIYGYTIELNGELVDCYDKYGNKIIGEKCIVESSFNTRDKAYLMMFSGGMVFMIIMIGLGTLFDSIMLDGEGMFG